MVQHLICEHGNHAWERPGQRGRKPRYCPEHRELSVPAQSTPAAVSGGWDGLVEAALVALDRLFGEDVRKVDYIITQLTEGKREAADEKLLAETLAHIIR